MSDLSLILNALNVFFHLTPLSLIIHKIINKFVQFCPFLLHCSRAQLKIFKRILFLFTTSLVFKILTISSFHGFTCSFSVFFETVRNLDLAIELGDYVYIEPFILVKSLIGLCLFDTINSDSFWVVVLMIMAAAVWFSYLLGKVDHNGFWAWTFRVAKSNLQWGILLRQLDLKSLRQLSHTLKHLWRLLK